MSGKSTKQIRKVAKEQVSNMWTQVMIQVLTKMELNAKESSFAKRFKIAMRYLFKKDVSRMIEG